MDKKEYDKEYRVKNREKLIEYSKKYYKNNKEAMIAQNKLNDWYETHPEHAKKTRADYFQKNKEKIKARIRERYKNDLNYRMANKLRSRFGGELRKYINGMQYKRESAIDLLGCTIKEFISYLEIKFKTGMNWDNYGSNGWHIDHVIPCSAFDLTLEENRKKCFHYTNLQPLWAKENYKKGNKNVTDGLFK